MDISTMMNSTSQILVMILFVLTMMLRNSKNIENWVIQWIVLGVALVLSYLQTNTIDIDVIMNAFMATGVCIFGENAIFRKKGEKSSEELSILKLVEDYRKELDISSGNNSGRCTLKISDTEIKDLIKKVIEEQNIKDITSKQVIREIQEEIKKEIQEEIQIQEDTLVQQEFIREIKEEIKIKHK